MVRPVSQDATAVMERKAIRAKRASQANVGKRVIPASPVSKGQSALLETTACKELPGYPARKVTEVKPVSRGATVSLVLQGQRVIAATPGRSVRRVLRVSKALKGIQVNPVSKGQGVSAVSQDLLDQAAPSALRDPVGYRVFVEKQVSRAAMVLKERAAKKATAESAVSVEKKAISESRAATA
jgi:hypothetical protein